MTTVQDIIAATAARYGLDPAVMTRIGQIESGLNPSAQNPNSSAGGVFQFIDSTWDQYGKGRNKLDAHSNIDSAGSYLSDTSAHLARTLGRAPQGWELYVGHQQGPGGASKLFSADPTALASSVVGSDQVSLNGGTADMSVGDFLSIWRNKYNGTKIPAMSMPVGNPAPVPTSELAGLFSLPRLPEGQEQQQAENQRLAQLIRY